MELNSKKKTLNSEKVRKESKTDKSRRRIDQNKSILLEWCSYCTTHGISNLSRANFKGKIVLCMWVLCFILSLIYCLYSILNVISEYLNHSVLIKMEIINESPIDFPAVTFCNINPFDQTKSKNYFDKVLEKQKLENPHDLSKTNYTTEEIVNLVSSNAAGDPNLSDKDRNNLGFQLEYMIITCMFDGVNCNLTNIKKNYNPKFGNCYTFNSGFDKYGNNVSILKVGEPGSVHGLRLQLFLGDEFSQEEYTIYSAARIVIHNQNITPIIESEGKDIPTGFQTNLGLRKNKLYRLESPYSSCIKNIQSFDELDSDLYRSMFTVLNMTTYRQKTCYQLCLQNHIISSCGCADAFLPNILTNVSNCMSLRSINCITRSRTYYFEKEIKYFCEQQCPVECDSEEYDMSWSQARYPTVYQTNYLRNRTNILSKFNKFNAKEKIENDHIQKSIVLINIFFDELSANKIYEIPDLSAHEVLGTKGGNLGLFAGMSLLSFIEIFELI